MKNIARISRLGQRLVQAEKLWRVALIVYKLHRVIVLLYLVALPLAVVYVLISQDYWTFPWYQVVWSALVRIIERVLALTVVAVSVLALINYFLVLLKRRRYELVKGRY